MAFRAFTCMGLKFSQRSEPKQSGFAAVSMLSALLFALSLTLASPALAQEADPQGTPEGKQAPVERQLSSRMKSLQELEQKLEATTAKVIHSVVGLTVGGRNGSGTLISSDGWIATAGHVSGEEPGLRVTVTMSDGQTYKGTTYGYYEALDYGLVRINPPEQEGLRPDFTYATLGDSDRVGQGEWVLAMGHPLGFEADRPPVVRVGRVTDPSNRAGMMVIDAPLISGDSGGPVFDAEGALIAINQSVSISNPRTNNVTPISGFKTLLSDLKRNRVYKSTEGLGSGGEVIRTLSTEEQKTYDEALSLMRQGLYQEAYDTITPLTELPEALLPVLLDGARMACKRARQLWRARERRDANDMSDAAVKLLEQAVEQGWEDVTTLRTDEDFRALHMRRDYKRLLNDLDQSVNKPLLALTVRTGVGNEVLIDEVAEGSEAERAGLRADDQVIAIDGVPTPDVLTYANALAALDITDQVTLTVLRDGIELSFDYNVGVSARDERTQRRDPVRENKFDLDLMRGWDDYADLFEAAVFSVEQRRDQERVAYATAVHRHGYLITKASNILAGEIWLRDDDGQRYQATLVASDEESDTALLKIEHELSLVVDFAGNDSVSASNGESAAPSISVQLASFVASLDDDGDAVTWGAVSVVAYNSDTTPFADPRGPFMGVMIDRTTEGQGALITEVTPDTPAERSGLKPDDRILEMDGESVSSGNALIEIINKKKVGQTVEMSVQRGEETLTLKLTFVMRSQINGDPYLGINTLSEGRGVKIQRITPYRAADRSGLWRDDRIIKVGDEEVDDNDGFTVIVKALRPHTTVDFTVLRDGEEMVIPVTVGDGSERPNASSDDKRTQMKGPITLRWRKLGEVIHHDGLLDPNDVGAPIINSHGQVVGLNIARSDRTRSLALPAFRVHEIVDALLEQAGAEPVDAGEEK